MRSAAALFLLVGATSALSADPAVLVNLSAGRPVVSLVQTAGTLTADLPPGSRRSVEALRLSGAGEKNLVLEAGGVYYLARFGALPRWYRLGETQVLAVNRSGRALQVTLPDGTTGLLAAGTPVLAESTLETPLDLAWTSGDAPEVRTATGPGLYQWVAEDGAVVLRPWSED